MDIDRAIQNTIAGLSPEAHNLLNLAIDGVNSGAYASMEGAGDTLLTDAPLPVRKEFSILGFLQLWHVHEGQRVT